MTTKLAKPSVDPVTLSVVWNKLLTITRETGYRVMFSAQSIVKSGHLPDWTFIRPMYWHDELVCYCYFRGHQMDTGGALSGGYFPRAYDCIAEGLNIPPLKVIRKGKVNEELYSLSMRNVRNAAGERPDNMN